MELTLGFSPCPNDTFIFDALVNGGIDTEGIQFKYELHDVQTLNQKAIEGLLDITKISYGVLPLVLNDYSLLQSGGALGMGVGPLLISKPNNKLIKEDIEKCVIALPGKNTTAHLLFSLAFPNVKNKRFMTFNEIEDAVLSDVVDGGVIIHENRFTYQQRGLEKIIDLGEFWERETQSPIPLGGIIANKKLGRELINKIDGWIKNSVEIGFAHYPNLSPFITDNAQEMLPEIMRKHIDLYVNEYTLNLGDNGNKAIQKLLEVFC